MQTAQVRWIGEEKFVATSPSGHAMALDADGKSNTAPNPMELLLMGLGACTAVDVVLILGEEAAKTGSVERIVLRGAGRGNSRKCGRNSNCCINCAET